MNACSYILANIFRVQGLFAPLYFLSSERKFPLRTFAPGAKVPGNFRSRELKFPGTFVPEQVSSLFNHHNRYLQYADARRSS